jgi:hypothetical protein
LLLLPALAQGQQIVRNGFEGLNPSWEKGSADAPYEERAHAITDLAFHDGKHSEYLLIDAKPGNHIHYQYLIGRAPIGEEFAAGVWLKADRPGIQLLARVVLPNQRDPANIANYLTTTLHGETYQRTGQWMHLAINRPVKLLRDQQLLLRAKLNREIDISGAYIDRLLLNVYAGPGPTQVWIDDLEIGPVEPGLTTPAVRQGGPPPAANTTSIVRPARPQGPLPEFRGGQIYVGNKRVLFRGIRFTDTALRPLRDAGFNTILFDNNVNETRLREAAEHELWVAPQLVLAGADGRPVPPDELTRQLNRYAGNSVLFVRFGGMFSNDQLPLVASASQAVRSADPNKLLAADVWDGLQPLSRNLDLVGIHRWPLMTTMELPQYREWLEMRRNLANPGTFTWTWIQTHLPEWYAQLLYEQPASAGFAEPVGPQPEHIQLLTFTALASGCRGLAYFSDRFLANSHQGRDRLQCCALLNLEMEMLEPLLVSVVGSPEWIDTSSGDVKAAVLRCAQGVLVLPMWQGRFTQFVPGQAAATNLTMTVPQVPQGMSAWLVSPADVTHLKPERVWPGMKVTIKEFGLTAAVLFTSDMDLIARLQTQATARRQLAAQWSYEMALVELEKVTKIQKRLEQLNKELPESAGLLEDARKRLEAAHQHYDNRLFAEAYHEGQRALRPLRLLMREQWEKSVRGLSTPVAIPHGITYYTLAKHWELREQVRGSIPGENLLPDGNFEDDPHRQESKWVKEDQPPLDEVEMEAKRVGQVVPPEEAKKDEKLRNSLFVFSAAPKEGKKCCMLQIRPKGLKPPPQALDRTLIAIRSPVMRLRPGTLVQISGWINIPTTIRASPDGALFYDSAGGEPLAIRLTQAMPWKQFTLYRRVPASGEIQVTLALTGLGTVLFDDIRVEPLVAENSLEGQQLREARQRANLQADNRANAAPGAGAPSAGR